MGNKERLKISERDDSNYLPSETLGMKEYFKPEGKPAPPLPLRPDFLISSMIQSGPMARISLVLCQSPYIIEECREKSRGYSLKGTLDERVIISIDVGEDSVLILKFAMGSLRRSHINGSEVLVG